MAKPAAGTLIATNSYTVSMRCAYLLNGATISTQVNSVGGAEPLQLVNSGTGLSVVTDGIQYTAANGILQLPSATINEFLNSGSGLSGATLLINYKSSGSFIEVSRMGGSVNDVIPFNDGNCYVSFCNQTRWVFTTPAGITFSNFNDAAATATAGGSWKFYINGVLKNTQTTSGTVDLGSSAWIGAGSLNGIIQYVYIWKRVLSDSELADITADPYGTIFSSGADVTEAVTDSIALSDSLSTISDAPKSFSDSISLSDVLAISTLGEATIFTADDILAFADSAVAAFGIHSPPSLRGNIDYDQIRVSARSGDGPKLLTLKGPFVPGNTVVFDADGNLIDAGHP